jgi:hypothetical protein
VTELKSKQETKAKHRENIKDLREKFSLWRLSAFCWGPKADSTFPKVLLYSQQGQPSLKGPWVLGARGSRWFSKSLFFTSLHMVRRIKSPGTCPRLNPQIYGITMMSCQKGIKGSKGDWGCSLAHLKTRCYWQSQCTDEGGRSWVRIGGYVITEKARVMWHEKDFTCLCLLWK